MAEPASRERLQPSLLDRLTDDSPESRRETFDQQTLSMRQLRQAVLRDLAWLLNTTHLAATEDLSAYPLAAKSTLNYGVPGMTGLSASGSRAAGIETDLAAAIRAFEPRIQPDSLIVHSAHDTSESAIPTLRFEIQGDLWALPLPEQLFIETAIDMETRLAVVTDTRARG